MFPDADDADPGATLRERLTQSNTDIGKTEHETCLDT